MLKAEGRETEADAARWTLFEQTLSAAVLEDLLSGLPDFEDVVALDRALALAAAHADAMKGLAFLMERGALREAAGLIEARGGDLRGAHEEAAVWASRLAGRHPLAALRLLRAGIRGLVQLGASAREVEALLAEAEALAASVDLPASLPDHPAFVAGLGRAGFRAKRR